VEFPIPFKEHRSSQINEHATQGSTQCDHEVEGGEISSRGFQANQFPMAYHAAGKEGGRVDENLEIQIHLLFIRIVLV
jgi:hypothetical protein